MDGFKRRVKIKKIFDSRKNPIKGQELAELLNVSRQVIVQDIALLRAEGLDLIGTPAGYKLNNIDIGILKTISTKHNSNDAMKNELSIIVENGGKIIDTIVEHEIYGELKANLHIKSYEDIKSFMDNIKNLEPLSKITDGIHLHTIEVESQESYEKILKELDKAGLLNK